MRCRCGTRVTISRTSRASSDVHVAYRTSQPAASVAGASPIDHSIARGTWWKRCPMRASARVHGDLRSDAGAQLAYVGSRCDTCRMSEQRRAASGTRQHHRRASSPWCRRSSKLQRATCCVGAGDSGGRTRIPRAYATSSRTFYVARRAFTGRVMARRERCRWLPQELHSGRARARGAHANTSSGPHR